VINKTVTIQNKLGLHARSANAFVRTVSVFSSSITVTNKYATANGKSIMSMMLLQASKGSEIELEIDGEDEQLVLEAIEKLINDKFGEDD
jgi:phosphotransferase system HPr (HPr) family protein